MKKLMILCLASMCSFPILANKIKVKVDYTESEKATYPSDAINYFAHHISFEMNDNTYEFKANDTFKAWSILLNAKEIGQIEFITNQFGKNTWKLNFDGYIVKVSFENFNDPREFNIEAEENTYFMTNEEPDCNSDFRLYDMNPSESDISHDDYITSARAKVLCGETDWIIALKASGLGEEIVSSFIFTSVVAMNVRGFAY